MNTIRLFLAKFGGDGFAGTVHDGGGDGDYVELGEVMSEEAVGDAEADALGTAGDDGDFGGEVGAVGEGEGGGGEGGEWAAEVFGEGVLGGVKV
jgi:hypothetical protein